jgi:hypothetical protein
LRKLQEQLGSVSRPVSLAKISRLGGVPAGTLRAIESGRRTFSLQIQERMRECGFQWDEKNGRWFFTYDHKAELSLHLLETFRRLSRGDNRSQDHDAHVVCEKAISLLQEVSVAEYTNFLLDFNSCLDRLRATYKIEGAKKIFDRRLLKYLVLPTRSGGQTLVKSFASNEFPEQLLDFSAKRKSAGGLFDETADQPEIGSPRATVTQPAA